MDLKDYWEILANYDGDRVDFVFFNNGFFGVKSSLNTVIYDKKGDLFTSGDYERVLCHDDRAIALLPRAHPTWVVKNLRNEFICSLDRNVQLYPNGAYSFLFNGETYYRDWLGSLPILLGSNVLKIVVGPDGLFAYKRRIRHYTLWYLCELKDGKLVTHIPLSNEKDIKFFANGNYVAYYRNNNVRVFNCRGHKIFSCNCQYTAFRKVGRNHFRAVSSKKYRGIYSAHDGKFVLEDKNVEIYWDNGAYYIPNRGLYLPKQKSFIRLQDIYEGIAVGESLFCFKYRNSTFVIDTDLTLAELRTKVISALLTATTNETFSAYLVRLLNFLY